jgi:hypothetical protein
VYLWYPMVGVFCCGFHGHDSVEVIFDIVEQGRSASLE